MGRSRIQRDARLLENRVYDSHGAYDAYDAYDDSYDT